MGKLNDPNPAFISDSLKLTKKKRGLLSKNEAKDAIGRFRSCDWGEVDGAVWLENDEAYKSGGRIFSVYTSGSRKIQVAAGADGRLSLSLIGRHLKRAC